MMSQGLPWLCWRYAFPRGSNRVPTLQIMLPSNREKGNSGVFSSDLTPVRCLNSRGYTERNCLETKRSGFSWKIQTTLQRTDITKRKVSEERIFERLLVCRRKRCQMQSVILCLNHKHWTIVLLWAHGPVNISYSPARECRNSWSMTFKDPGSSEKWKYLSLFIIKRSSLLVCVTEILQSKHSDATFWQSDWAVKLEARVRAKSGGKNWRMFDIFEALWA